MLDVHIVRNGQNGRTGVDPKRDTFGSVRADILAERLRCSTEELQIRYSEFGKPYVVNHPNFHFSTTYTDGLMAVACSDLPVGIDAEYYVPNQQNADVAATQFTAEEQSQLGDAPNSKWTQVFYEIWTQKEAFVKGLGLGFQIDFLRFSIGTNNEPVRCDPKLALAEEWYTHSRITAPNLILALATPYQMRSVNIHEISI